MYTKIREKLIGEKKRDHSSFLLRQSSGYLSDVQDLLNTQIDKRLVRTFYDLFVAILVFRNRANGLLLSELGGYICGFDKAPAGTKRISNLLRSKKWTSSIIDDYLFDLSKKRINNIISKDSRALMLWDDSRLEKPESWFLRGLCSVYSSKGKRLTKIKRGYYRPPASRICVPGFKWTGVLVSSLGDIPSVCQMSWWTTRGKHKELGSNIIYKLLKKIHQEIGKKVLHVLDRGYASEEMIERFLNFDQDFLLRWKKNHLLVHEKKGCKKTHLLARSFKGQSTRTIWDKERKIARKVSVAWAAVKHSQIPDKQLYLVIVRDVNGLNSPMYLLTTVKIDSKKLAWEMVHSYMHRWEIEQAFRFGKSELAMESPRLWFWENRLKLLGIVTLIYDFLLKLLRNWEDWTTLLFKKWCHRTGNRYRNASIPIYRLRAAISVCLFFCLAQNSG